MMITLDIVVVLVLFLFRYLTLRSIALRYLRGPSSPSILLGLFSKWQTADTDIFLGHGLELRAQPTVGGLEKSWQKTYGNTFRIGGCFAVRRSLTVENPCIPITAIH